MTLSVFQIGKLREKRIVPALNVFFTQFICHWWHSTMSSMEFVQAIAKVVTELEELNLYGG